MEEIKIELDNINVCYGCLSVDRKLFTQNDLIPLYLDLLEDQRSLILQDSRIPQLCWECVALLKRINSFQKQVKHAQCILLKHVYEGDNSYKSLSKLSTITRENFDIDIQYKKSRTTKNSNKNNVKDKNKIEVKEIKLEKSEDHAKEEIDYNQHNYEDISDLLEKDQCIDTKDEEIEKDNPETNNCEFDDDYMGIDDKLDTNDEANTDDRNDKVNKRKNRVQLSIRKYLKDATVKQSNDIEFDSLRDYFDEVFLYEDEYELLLKRDHKVPNMHTCKFCKRDYIRELDLKRHCDLNHPVGSGPYKCSECGANIDDKSELVEHWRLHTKVMRCKMCSHNVRAMDRELKKHLKRLHSLLYTCLLCGECFGGARVFGHHYLETHIKLTCDYCNRKFVQKKILERHIRRQHLPPYCKICDKLFNSYHTLDNHSRSNHPQLYEEYKVGLEQTYCVECDKQFDSVYKYRRHLNQTTKHRAVPRASVPCKVCGKLFARTKYMNNHYRLFHTERSKHYCEKCDKSFVSGYSLRMHKKHVHEKQIMPRTKVCDLCGRAFTTNRVLENHRRTHTGERPYKCSHCPAAFAQRTAMKSHEKTQHKNQLAQYYMNT